MVIKEIVNEDNFRRLIKVAKTINHFFRFINGKVLMK